MPTALEQRLIPILIPDLDRWEGKFRHMYLDTKGLVTTGIGNLVKTPADAIALPFLLMPSMAAATDEQKRLGWNAVKAMPAGLRARAYEVATLLRLTEQTVDHLVAKRLEHEFLPGIRDLYPHFDAFPRQAQQALVDLAYNCGLAGLAKFENLREAVLRQDWVAASRRCHRSSSREDRNVWCASMFMFAASQPEFA